jgi:hypothetical protein
MIQPIESVHEPDHGFTTSDGISIDWRKADPETVIFAVLDRVLYLDDIDDWIGYKTVAVLLKSANTVLEEESG